MNQQEIFTKVKNHLLTQMEQSTDGQNCKYRDPFGLMCAVGCLIPDELYSPDIENKNVDSLPSNIKKFLGLKNMGLLTELQEIHDYGYVDLWGRSLRELATQYNLEF